MSKSKKLLITLDEDLYEKAKVKSKGVVGRENVSGLISVLLMRFVGDE